MKLLLDENLPHELRHLIPGHDVYTTAFMKWGGLKNGELLARAAQAGFEALITIDSGIEYKQNLATLPCSVMIIRAQSNALEHIEPPARTFANAWSIETADYRSSRITSTTG